MVLLLVLGAAHDLWSAAHPALRPLPPLPAAPERAVASAPPSGILPGSSAARGASPTAPIDLNTASPRELDALPGIGPVLAARIVEQRARHGRFERLEDLLAVRGIGPRLLERIRPAVTLTATPPPPAR